MFLILELNVSWQWAKGWIVCKWYLAHYKHNLT